MLKIFLAIWNLLMASLLTAGAAQDLKTGHQQRVVYRLFLAFWLSVSAGQLVTEAIQEHQRDEELKAMVDGEPEFTLKGE